MVPEFCGRIVEWDQERGCGWLKTEEGQRIFLHWHDFAERHKRPEIGDMIRFVAGRGPTGQLCATNAIHFNDGGRFRVRELLLLVSLLVLPALAIAQLPMNRQIAGIAALTISLLTYWLYLCDKQRAREKSWRIPEANLHLMELIGGWPGAFVAQRWLRHKCSKAGYQMVFWTIVTGYQLIALEFLQDWRMSRAITDLLSAN